MLQRIYISLCGYSPACKIIFFVLLLVLPAIISCAPARQSRDNATRTASLAADTSGPIKFSEKKLKKPLFDTAAVYPDHSKVR